MNEYGVITHPDTVRLERLLPGPIERVWDYLTDSTKRGKWFATGKMELRVGGSVEFFFHHADLSVEKTPPKQHKDKARGVGMKGKITACDPPHLLSFTFGHAGEQTALLVGDREARDGRLTVRRVALARLVHGAGRGVLEVRLDDVADDRELLAVHVVEVDAAPEVVCDAPDRVGVALLLVLRGQRRHSGQARFAAAEGGLGLVRLLVRSAP